ncbi:MAG: hypothetical protein JXC32_20060 [Anaerolineae bacterium]|nr:hypothetical protein [Anaerolineae bacterium]
MAADTPVLTVRTTKPDGALATALADLGIEVRSIDDEEDGAVDRYLLGPQLAVERRTWTTFLLGIQDKSLFLSAIYLREHFETAVLIVEGDFDYDRTGFSRHAIRGALSAMVLEYGLSVLSTTDEAETAALLAMMARHAQAGVPEISLVPKRKALDLPDLQRRVVEMLPGCGRVTARDLLQHFGSVSRILAATEAELRHVQGIGRARAAEIHKVLHAEYRAVDTERNLEDALEAQPGLLFEGDVDLLARQHVIITLGGERHVVDLIFHKPKSNTVFLVELKRGALTADHEAQLRRYFDVAGQSALLSEYLDRGAILRGILATASDCVYRATSPEIEAVVVDKEAVIEVLGRLRRERLRLSGSD